MNNVSILDFHYCQNYKIEEFVIKLGMRIESSLLYFPWSKRINERNYYSANVVVRKLMDEDRKML